MSSEKFENDQKEVKTQIEFLRKRLDRDLPISKGENRKQLVREMERDAEDLSVLIRDMNEEVRKAPPAYRQQLNSQVRSCQRDLDSISHELQRAASDSGANRPRSFDPEDDFERHENQQRARLMQGLESMNRASESVARSQAISAETDEIGRGIIGELGEQGESLLRTRDRLVETQSNLSKSRTILNSMGRRIITNKLLLVIIIIIELCILAGVVYWKFFR